MPILFISIYSNGRGHEVHKTVKGGAKYKSLGTSAVLTELPNK
jgi:hypothetical protein